MKGMVKFTVLLAALLLMSGVAFGVNSHCPICYEFTYHDLDNPNGTTECLTFDFCSNEVYNSGGSYFLVMFFDASKLEALAISPRDDVGCANYFKFHGEDLAVVKGIGACDNGFRLKARGVRIDCPCGGG